MTPIENAYDMEVFGDWIKFTDGEGATIKITPLVVKELLVFALDNVLAFDEEAWHRKEPDFSNIDRSALLRELLPEIQKMFGVEYKKWEDKE
jgi:succinyl-CoA synthetase beta subunit